MAYVNTHDNKANLLTKLLPNGEKRWRFVISSEEREQIWQTHMRSWLAWWYMLRSGCSEEYEPLTKGRSI